MSINFIYFDVGQVLVSMKLGFNDFVADYGLSDAQAELFDQVWVKYSDDFCRGRITHEEIVNHLKKEANFNHPGFDLVNETVNRFQPIRESFELVTSLIDQYQIGLLSNAYPGMISGLIKQIKLPNLEYKAIVDSSICQLVKPDKAIFKLAAKAAATQPEAILFVDDKLENLEAAQACGWQTIQFSESKARESVEQINQVLARV